MSNSYIGWALHEEGSGVRRVGLQLHPCGSLNSGLWCCLMVSSYHRISKHTVHKILGECFYLLTSISVSL
ncbi:hypothetical protein L210DRAFT_3548896, partial [Boletus edulis BED1]